nr:MAG TPA: hypothetical protein [Caudoviricetes sp.]
MKEKIYETQEELLKSSINGCITGSSMLSDDFDTWDSIPDIDVFVYGESQLVHAIDYMTMKLGFVPGKYDESARAGEEWKVQRILEGRYRKKVPINTVSLIRDGVTVNLTHKKNQTSVIDVISNFDMTIIMLGIDIPTGYTMDLRGPYKKTARPNPLRPVKYELVNTSYWIRQFDRVMKYWNRGYDTRPMAKFYLDLIDKTLADGCLFKSDASQKMYDTFSNEFAEVHDKIDSWLKDKEDK